MPTVYLYNLWNGKKVIGQISNQGPIMGRALIVPVFSPLKQPYNRNMETIELPIMMRELDYKTWEVCLDVRRKSKRQINILLQK